jgi:hypothetical protein
MAEDLASFVPIARSFADVAGNDNGVDTAIVDDLYGFADVVSGMGRAREADMEIAQLGYANLRGCGAGGEEQN